MSQQLSLGLQQAKPVLAVTLRRVGLKKFQIVIGGRLRYQGVAFSRARIDVMLGQLGNRFTVTIKEEDSRQ